MMPCFPWHDVATWQDHACHACLLQCCILTSAHLTEVHYYYNSLSGMIGYSIPLSLHVQSCYHHMQSPTKAPPAYGQ